MRNKSKAVVLTITLIMFSLMLTSCVNGQQMDARIDNHIHDSSEMLGAHMQKSQKLLENKNIQDGSEQSVQKSSEGIDNENRNVETKDPTTHQPDELICRKGRMKMLRSEQLLKAHIKCSQELFEEHIKWSEQLFEEHIKWVKGLSDNDDSAPEKESASEHVPDEANEDEKSGESADEHIRHSGNWIENHIRASGERLQNHINRANEHFDSFDTKK